MDYEIFDQMSRSLWNRRMYADIAKTAIKRCTAMVPDFFTRPVRLADVGCGTGAFAEAMAARIPTAAVVLADCRGGAVREAKEIIGRICNCPVRGVIGDVADLNLSENPVDLIISRGSIRFWPNQEAALTALLRSVRPGGLLYVGGGRGSGDFQRMRQVAEVQEREHLAWCRRPDIPNYLWEDKIYIRYFKRAAADYRIFRGEDGHWMLWQRRGGSNA
ncbi:MAG: class I SAM-dependent methyltransferase [Eubacteriales bacterium]|nr:class I SAM-dependent methyltransferase [Eubacteriales bacterium]